MNLIEQIGRDARVTVRRRGAPDRNGNCVVYWMQRAQRTLDNPALNIAVSVANELRMPVVAFLAIPAGSEANQRHLRFLADGIADIAEGLTKRRVGFVVESRPEHDLLRFCSLVQSSIVIGDENPLREMEQWRKRVARGLRVPFWTVDADVIVPSRLLEKEHFAARTIRPRLQHFLPQFLIAPGNPVACSHWEAAKLKEYGLVSDHVRIPDSAAAPLGEWRGGGKEALRRLKQFIHERLAGYPDYRSRPELDGTSRLSPYLHFGHLGPHTVALAIQAADVPEDAKQAFLEQLIVRRELAINFVRFNPSYDSMECLEPWAKRSLARHASDRRPLVYGAEQLEDAETHDPLWNAAQKQMLLTGWMHNYLRMYWAKKILEWSPSIASAYQRAIVMNDRYELDGRDPNGYAGIAWAIVGKHDRPWFDRPLFGQVRSMSLASTGRKFDSRQYIAKIERLERAHA